MTEPAGCASDARFAASRSTGKERDQESGNDYFEARYYASAMGRFLSPDPSALKYADPTNPQDLNLYAYVRNNPLTFIDPTGRWLEVSCITVDTGFDPGGNSVGVNSTTTCTFWDNGQGPNLPTNVPAQQTNSFKAPSIDIQLGVCRDTILADIAKNIPNGQNAQYRGPTVAPNADQDGKINGAININAFIPGMDANPTGRYFGGGNWLTGGNGSLHVPQVNNPDSSTFNRNGDPTNAGPTAVNGQKGYQITAHTDSADAFTPFGWFFHLWKDVSDKGAHRPPCP